MNLPSTPSSFHYQVRAEFLEPVRYQGQAAAASSTDYIVSTHRHHVGLLCKHVETLKSLPDNWDGYGAAAPSIEAIGNVLDLLPRLPASWTMRLHQDDIMPSTYGTITLEWQAGHPEFVGLEVGDATWALFGRVDGQIMDGPTAEYPNELLRLHAVEALQALYPEVVSQDICAYTY